MADLDLNALVNDALVLWVETTGVDLGATSFRINGDEYNQYNLVHFTKEFNESRDLDPSGLTTLMLMRDVYKGYLSSRYHSAFDQITTPDMVVADIKRTRPLWDLLNHPVALGMVADFRQTILDSCAHYGLSPDEDFTAWLDDVGLATLRRDALRSVETLATHQFAQGERDPLPLRYNRHVYEFWNMNSLLLALRSQRLAGITLVLIRDPMEMFSFFCFAVKDGDNITILTDAPNVPHPDYKHMSRRPDRALAKRAAQHWFPYDLLDLKVTADGKALYSEARTALVPVNAEAVAVRELKDLHPATVIWATLAFEIIRHKFQERGFKTPQLSYTGEMIRLPHALIGEHAALVREGHYKPIELPNMTRDDLADSATVASAGGFRKSTGFNHWMVERYGDQVPEGAFNVIGEMEVAALLPTIEKGDLAPRPSLDPFNKGPRHLTLSHVDPTSFGTKERLAQDRVWTARKNQAVVIQRLAEEEFVRERDNVVRWYEERVRANAEFLLNAAAHGTLRAPTFTPRQMSIFPPMRSSYPTEEMYQHELRAHERRLKDHHETGEILSQEFHPRAWGPTWDIQVCLWNATRYKMLCFERPEVQASIRTMFKPNCPSAVALVCGVAVSELPWPLQHWYYDEPYHGNSILDRIDHEDWVLHNPWRPNIGVRNGSWGHDRIPGLNLRIVIAQCKLAFHARRKALGLPRLEIPEPPPKRRREF